jgi:hypothetical protein
MEKMKIIRIDFVENDKCCFCMHKLSSKIAYIIELDNGDEVQCGPTCAEKRFPDMTNVPNFTRASLDHFSNKSSKKDTGEGHIKKTQSNRELEYLQLRCKYLADFDDKNGIKFPFLMNIFNKNQFEITDEDRIKISNLMKKMENTKLGYKNLMACYMAKKILGLWIKQKSDKYAVSTLNYLVNNCFLTEAQVNGANNWIINKKKIPKINPEWFFKLKKQPQ